MFVGTKYTIACGVASMLAAAAVSAQDAKAQDAKAQDAKAQDAKPLVEKTAKVRPGLYEVVAANNAVYVASTGARGSKSAAVYKLDGTTLEITDSISLNDAPAFGLGINRKTNTLYTTNTRSSSVHAIDLGTMKVVATIALPAPPAPPKAADASADTSRRPRRAPSAHAREVVVNEATNMVYVSDHQPAGKVWVIDGKTNTLKTGIDSVGARATGLAVDQAANLLYTTNLGSNEVSVVDLTANKVVKRFPCGGEAPINLAFDAIGNHLFVANQKSGNATVLDAATGNVLATVPTGEGALSIAFNAANKTAYVTNRTAGTTTVIDGATFKVLANLETGTLPQTVAVDPSTNKAYVSSKAKGLPRNAPAGTQPPDDPGGDTVTSIVLQ